MSVITFKIVLIFTVQIEIFPTTVSMLGYEAVRVTGLSLSGSLNVTARIREFDWKFSCHVIEDLSAVCVIPAIFRTGEFTFDFDPFGEGWNFSAAITVGKD